MKSNRINFKKLKIGQKVWCIQFGYCKIEYIGSGDYPIYIHLEKQDRAFSYTKCGRLTINDKFPSLFSRKPSLI